MPGIVTAGAPTRLIERGKFGLSVWTSVLLDKFLYGRPSHRLVQDLADHGLNMAPGTLTGGLKTLAPLFAPLEQAFVQKLRAAHHLQLEQAVQGLAQRRTSVLADPLLAAPAAKVLQSMAAHWDGLTVFVQHPWIPLDNNMAESDMREPVVRRKNFYGLASQWSGELAATMYSLMMTLRLWKINARAWLGAYLQACMDNGNCAPADIAPFLPWANGASPACGHARLPPSEWTYPRRRYRQFMIYCAREFSVQDIQTIKDLMEQNPRLKRAALSRKLWELFAWTKPNGEIKEMTCRVALLRMQADGLITLPPSQLRKPPGKPHFPPTPLTDPQAPVQQPVHELGPLTLRPISGTAPSRLWNECIARYHYLGYTPMSGSQMRYNVFAGERLVALLSFGASAWRLKAREHFVGWSETQRQHNLQLVVNIAGFLILPWIQSKGLASKILAKAARQLPEDWLARYGFRPVLLETFVEFERHRGTCYKSANWINVGRTTGRGKKSTSHEQLIPLKDIWLYPLRKNFAAVLCQ